MVLQRRRSWKIPRRGRRRRKKIFRVAATDTHSGVHIQRTESCRCCDEKVVGDPLVCGGVGFFGADGFVTPDFDQEGC